MLRVLLTNDDGIHADGIRALARQLAPHCKVLVVAPHDPSSASSHSITLHKPLRLERMEDYVAGEDGAAVEAYACSGTPGDCVMLGALHVFADRLPHLVISGVNDGCNVAQDLSYSGTVGGALEGAVIGIPSFSVSLDGYERMSYGDAAVVVDLLLSLLLYGKLFHWHAGQARELACGAGNTPGRHGWGLRGAGSIDKHIEHYPAPDAWYPDRLEATPCFNINIPDTGLAGISGVRWTRAGYREYREVVREAVDPRGRLYYWIAGERVEHENNRPGTDTHALSAGFISITPISYDMTSKGDLDELTGWFAERAVAEGSQTGHDDG